MTIVFESHSTSIDNERGIASGHLDCPLSQKGVQQAKDLGNRYKDTHLTVVYCSDLMRSRDTAKIAFPMKDIQISEDARLREWNYGKFNGALASEVEKQKMNCLYQPFPDGESLQMALKRIDEFLDANIINCGIPVLIIGHRAVFYALEQRYKKYTLEELVSRPWSWQPGWIYTSLLQH